MFKTKTQRPVEPIAGSQDIKDTNTVTQIQKHNSNTQPWPYRWTNLFVVGDAEAFRPRWLFWLSLRIKKTQLEKKVLAIYFKILFLNLCNMQVRWSWSKDVLFWNAKEWYWEEQLLVKLGGSKIPCQTIFLIIKLWIEKCGRLSAYFEFDIKETKERSCFKAAYKAADWAIKASWKSFLCKYSNRLLSLTTSDARSNANNASNYLLYKQMHLCGIWNSLFLWSNEWWVFKTKQTACTLNWVVFGLQAYFDNLTV